MKAYDLTTEHMKDPIGIDPEKNYDPDSEPPVSLMRKDFKEE